MNSLPRDNQQGTVEKSKWFNQRNYVLGILVILTLLVFPLSNAASDPARLVEKERAEQVYNYFSCYGMGDLPWCRWSEEVVDL